MVSLRSEFVDLLLRLPGSGDSTSHDALLGDAARSLARDWADAGADLGSIFDQLARRDPKRLLAVIDAAALRGKGFSIEVDIRTLRGKVEAAIGAGALSPASFAVRGGGPTMGSLRALLDAVLLDESDVNAFCLDNFAKTRAAFAEKDNKGERIQKLLARDGRTPEARAKILEKLRAAEGERVAENEALLVWEPAPRT